MVKAARSCPEPGTIFETFKNMDVFARAYMDVLAAFSEMVPGSGQPFLPQFPESLHTDLAERSSF
jgi:hypothetical protein